MKIAARFVTSAAKPADFPPADLPEIAVVGRSNVGKSSLINTLVGQSGLARTSRTPGRTRLVNWFAIEDRFYLVDLPGYGYAEVSRATRDSWRPLIEGYLGERTSLVGVVLLIDIRRGVQDDELDFVPWLDQHAIPVVVVLTKADKLAKHKRTLEVARVRQVLALRRDPLAVSTLSNDGIDPLWRAVLNLAKPPGMIGVRIAPATTADLDAIDEIERHSFVRPWPRATFEAELARDVARLDVARAPGVIGFCNYWIVVDADARTGELEILAIATHPDHRRAGVAAALLDRALAQGRAHHAGLASLEVRRSNAPAIALYQRAGFRTVHVRKQYYQDGEDALIMLSELSP